MMKTFNFYTKNNNTNTFFNKSTNYSKILDNIILTDVIKKNSYLFTKNDDLDLFDDKPIILKGSSCKIDDDFTKATLFLANYKKYKNSYKIPYIYGKMYKLIDGTPIVFYDDEVQIGFDTYRYTDFSNLSILNSLTANTKKIIINIYTTGTANININL